MADRVLLESNIWGDAVVKTHTLYEDHRQKVVASIDSADNEINIETMIPDPLSPTGWFLDVEDSITLSLDSFDRLEVFVAKNRTRPRLEPF